MAANDAVWGIDIGACALKALRCRINPDDKSRILAEDFDYVEYPTIIGQPDADAEAIVRDALKTFLSRKSVKHDQVAISVSGQNGLARFIKLPPVEEKQIPNIVRYEARQQIPFKLEEVIWDYQQLPGGAAIDGAALEAEVGLFAMKRDQVFKAIKPLQEVGVEVDYIQLAPLAIFNFVVFDQLKPIDPKDFDPENPPESTVILSIGTETTDLVVTNGLRVWQRSIPLGGNHFTRALTKQLKITFGKAEHLKKNINSAGEDAKAIIKAMRPVLQDLLTEVQTSIRYFTMNVDKEAKLGRMIALGNAMKLSGLRSFLSQGLELEVVKLDAYARLVGSSVVAQPAFRDNLLSYGTCYGLCLQGLKQSLLRTNLLPQEVNQERLIKGKKPWAIAAAATLLLGFTLNYFGHWVSLWSAGKTGAHASADSTAGTAAGESAALIGEWTKLQERDKDLRVIAANLRQTVELPRLAPEVLKALSDALPRQPRDQDYPPDISSRVDMQIEHVLWEHFRSKDEWNKATSTGPAKKEDESETSAEPAEEEQTTGKGGWAVEVKGLHYHNGPRYGTGDSARSYVEKTVLKFLAEGSVMLPDEKGQYQSVRVAALGIQSPKIVIDPAPEEVDNPAHGINDDPNFKQPPKLLAYKFTFQFWWDETTLTARQSPKQPAEPSEASTASVENR